MDNHTFCRNLLRVVQHDLGYKRKDFSATKSSFGGYEIQGPNRFHHYSKTCCVASAIAEAMETYHDLKINW